MQVPAWMKTAVGTLVGSPSVAVTTAREAASSAIRDMTLTREAARQLTAELARLEGTAPRSSSST